MKTKARTNIQSLLIINILLAITWVLINGEFGFSNFVFGFILGFFILKLSIDHNKSKKGNGYFITVFLTLNFILFFIKEVVKSCLVTATEILKRKHNFTPGIIAIPLDVKTDFQITLLANMITLTPGTFSIDVSVDKKILYIHAMNITDKQELIQGIKNGFEKRILEISQG